MKQIYRLLMPLCAIIALALLAACGPYDTSSQGAPTTAGQHPSPVVTIKPRPTELLTPAPTKAPPHSALTGPVTLNASASVYQPGDTIVLILNNQSGQTIHFPDHLTDCTVILLQRLVNGIWTPVAPCRLMTVTRLHSLNPGQDLVVRLIAPRTLGTYRGVLAYFAPGSSRTIFSGDFRVA
jgi:hypothetical protein